MINKKIWTGGFNGALRGVRVIDASRVLAGPFSGSLLADHGADVIKIEAAEGDETRKFGPPFVGDSAAYYYGINRNKRSVVLDLANEEGRVKLCALLENADILIENFKSSTLRHWNMGDQNWFIQRFPKLIHCRITGFGDSGDLGGLPGYDAVVQAVAGLMSINGEPDSNPVRLGVPIVDLSTGFQATIGVLAALHERYRSGKGQRVEISLYSAALSVAHPFLSNYLASGLVPKAVGNGHANIVPYGLYPTKSGPLFVAVANDRQFAVLCCAIGCEALVEDERFATNPKRVENREALEAALRSSLAQTDGGALWKNLMKAGVPAAPVFDLADVATAQHTVDCEMVVSVGGEKTPGIAVKMSRTPGRIASSPPTIGQHTKDILC